MLKQSDKKVSVRLTDYEDKLIRTYAEIEGISVSELIRSRVLSFISESELNSVFKEAYDRYTSEESKLYSVDEAMDMIK